MRVEWAWDTDLTLQPALYPGAVASDSCARRPVPHSVRLRDSGVDHHPERGEQGPPGEEEDQKGGVCVCHSAPWGSSDGASLV